MRTISRYLIREVATHSGVGFAVVLGVFVVTRLNSLLADSAAGALPGGVVLELLGLRAVMALPSLLPATLYVGILLALSRMARDHELEALGACGIPPHRQYGAVFGFAAVVAVGIAFLSFTGRPWAAARFQQTQDRAIADARLGDIPLGTFLEVDPSTHAVLFAESRSSEDASELRRILLRQDTADGLRVTLAESGFESNQSAPGFRYLHLRDGIEYEINAAGDRLNVSEFQQSSLRIPVATPEGEDDLEKTLAFSDLWGSTDPEIQAELQWRAAMPVSSLILVLMAIPLAQAGSSRNRYVSAAPALLFYLLYRSLLGTAKSWVANGTLALLPGMWLIHGGAAAAALAMLLYSLGSVDWRRALVRAGGGAA